jgi:hypothetical protein
MTNTKTETVTIELTLAELYDIRLAVSDSCSYWFRLLIACEKGERPDLYPDGCLSIMEKTNALSKKLYAIHEEVKNKQ